MNAALPRRWVLPAADLAHTDPAVSTPAMLATAGPAWFPAVIPGGVHESLMAAGLLDDPYLDDNEQAAAWIEQRAWWYRARLEPPGRMLTASRLRLVCHALDTVADLWLDGTPLGRHESMFRPADFDITALVDGPSTLLIRFAPPLAGLTPPAEVAETARLLRALSGDPDAPPGPTPDEPARSLRRKATFSWGWDFAPRLPSVGVAGPVDVVADQDVTITGWHLRTLSIDLVTRRAEVAVSVEADVLRDRGGLAARVTLTSPQGDTVDLPLSWEPGGGTSRRAAAVLPVEDVQPWWTHDLGHQSRYDVLITVGDAGGERDRVAGRTGIRTVEVDRGPDPVEGGRSFRFTLNGVPLFARGANWVPPSMLPGSVPDARYRSLVELARAANMTMLRVWGGGIYEAKAFYDMCDELGILVWQDFMFACIDYPSDDPGLMREVTAEAAFQVRRLRNHPCMALWCGNNEVHAMHALARGDGAPGNWGWRLFHQVLPAAVSEHSPGACYWPGSPWADSDPAGPNGVADGDRHAWEVWHGLDFGAGGPATFATRGEAMHWNRYAHDEGKFISEFGLHAVPELATLRRWSPRGQLELGAPALLHRIKDKPAGKGDALLEWETGRPATVAQFVDRSMAVQAEGLKFGIEHYRRRQPHCGGTLLWQFNDPWPGMSWSVLDYDLVPKAGYYAAQRAYAPVLASFLRTADDALELWVTNSSAGPVRGRLRVEVARFAGERVLDEVVRVEVEPLTSRPVWRAAPGAVAAGPDRYAWVFSPDGLTAANRMFFARLKELETGPGRLRAQVSPLGEGRAEVRISSAGFNYLTRVTAGVPGARFSRNYVDLRDGDDAVIEVSGLPRGYDLRALAVASYGPSAASVTVAG